LKFVEVPIKVALISEIEMEENTGVEPEYRDSFLTFNTDHIVSFFSQGDGKTTQMFFINGEDVEIELTYKEVRTLVL